MLWFATASCWGFDDSSIAQRFIIERAIARIDEDMDALSLRSVPENYIQALTGISKPVGSFVRMSSQGKEPVDALREFSPILKAVGAHLVIVIEDIDRKGSKFDAVHIQALLNRLREVENVSFVVSASPDSGLDFAKISDVSVHLPRLTEPVVMTLCDRIRTHCRERFPSDIDPHPNRKTLTEQRRASKWSPGFHGMHTSWTRAMAALTSTPRKLKSMLHRFESAWERMHGEVDMDE